MSDTPSDAEIRGLAAEGNGVYQDDETAVWEITDPSLIKFARAVLAKWGTPQLVDIGFTIENRAGIDVLVWEDGGCQPATTAEVAMWKALAAVQQPVVREPLTCEWTHNDDDGYWDTSCGKAWRFDDGGPKENNMNFCHCCGKTLRIKGKEAVNADT